MTAMPEFYKQMVAGKNGLEKKDLFRDLMDAFCASHLNLSQQEVREVTEFALSEVLKAENHWNVVVEKLD